MTNSNNDNYEDDDTTIDYPIPLSEEEEQERLVRETIENSLQVGTDILPLHVTEAKVLPEGRFAKWVDVGMPTLWNAEDFNIVRDEIRRVREGKVHPETFEDKLRRCRSDETAVFEKDNTKKFEPIQIGEDKWDLITNVGLASIARAIAGVTDTGWEWMELGTGVSEERSSDTRLANGIYATSMISNGYRAANGVNILFCGQFGARVDDSVITEMGIVDRAPFRNPQHNLFLRTVYPPESWVHQIKDKTFTAFTQSIKQISVT